ncbi:MAG: site-2 protease family protein [Polyangia bacterium]|jgi:membrane-associated protease RseP (regulator of RpoE activity)|nr:site-2 protease family protein [Polyangia bacterium]
MSSEEIKRAVFEDEMLAPPRPPRRSLLLHLGLFLATCVTTTFVGLLYAGSPAPELLMGGEGFEQGGLDLENWWRGLVFSATLLGILLTHEMGHFLAARIHRVDVSLPYFIPVPFGLGTFGAVISMRERIKSRNALLDIGAAGPLAGLAVALPLLVVGLWLSPVEDLPLDHVGMTEGNSIFYLGLKLVMFGELLPSGGRDVMLHPVAWAAWVGLLVTMLNLIPVGQFDGGHVAFAFFGRSYERFSRLVSRLLPVLGVLVFAYVFYEAIQKPEPLPSPGDRAFLLLQPPGHFPALQEFAVPWLNTPWAAASMAFSAAMPWFVWTILIFGLRIGRHPPFDPEPLSPSRKRIGILLFVVFVLIFMPIPLKVG